ncbi:hypothetical protein OB03_11130 [Brevundimonas sp. GN22]
MEGGAGQYFFRFFTSLPIFYALQVFLLYGLRWRLSEINIIKYNNNEDLNYIWNCSFKDTVKNYINFIVARSLMMAIFCAFFGYGGLDAHWVFEASFLSLMFIWMATEVFWATSTANKTAKAVWQTMSE